jgi:hypothetical protein
VGALLVRSKAKQAPLHDVTETKTKKPDMPLHKGFTLQVQTSHSQAQTHAVSQ